MRDVFCLPASCPGGDDGRSSIEAHGTSPERAVSGDHYRGPTPVDRGNGTGAVRRVEPVAGTTPITPY
ncbi:hypothetical protein B005_0718 [Nocardiopsis alba ATCC BAA-2165]|uniref:Uncharacterized protein n=1 Tax=Nocardiopsis alba (strain ATCC BAA-2165 / BE74) TaxID=1205910 RepID=J7L773_NOCAA|nr:hypothetical protein B005_0718 [Nocardiopsis alba ATCC BAA-2165]